MVHIEILEHSVCVPFTKFTVFNYRLTVIAKMMNFVVVDDADHFNTSNDLLFYFIFILSIIISITNTTTTTLVLLLLLLL